MKQIFIFKKIFSMARSRLEKFLAYLSKKKYYQNLKKNISTGSVLAVFTALLFENYETAIAFYLADCYGDEAKQNEVQKLAGIFFASKEGRKVALSAKSRYYEFFLNLLSEGTDKSNLAELLYSKKAPQLDKLKKMLLAPTLTTGSFFANRIEEWRYLFKQGSIPKVTKTSLSEEIEAKGKDNDKQLFDALNALTPKYFLRKMAQPCLEDFFMLLDIENYFYQDQKKIRVLDYGCGGADMSIYLAYKGNPVTICDIESGNLKPAFRRFELRQLPVTAIGATAQSPIPHFADKFDLIIATEVLEHIRCPQKLLDIFNQLMHKKSVLMLGSFPFTRTNAKGDHLKEAVDQRENLKQQINNIWQKIPGLNKQNILVKK
jgi:2-polyprenyl-3-methyl-5-hydroxy-6-metoxy-1,4-benzoquinol methylase